MAESPWLFVGIAIVVGVVILCSLVAAAKRRKMLRAFASEHGLRFDPSKSRDIDRTFGGVSLFGKGHSRYGRNFIIGQWDDREVWAFDYHYTTGSGKNQTHHTAGVLALWPEFPLRPLQIRREGFFDRVTEFFGHDDIDFESAEFSREFYVKASDRKWAYDVLHTRAMELLFNGPKVTLEMQANCLVLFRGSLMNPADIEAVAALGGSLLDMIPEYVRRERMGQP